MAVYAAHLTRTLQGTPSVFQVTAQEALGATVKPALRKFVEYLASVYPNKCRWCVSWYDELYLLFDCCLQYHYLKHYAASFSESFYDLIRVPRDVSNEFSSGQRLPPLQETGSLVLLVLLPYLRGKLEGLVHKWREADEDGVLGKSRSASLRRAAVRVYSVAHLVWECGRVAQLCAYIRGTVGAHSPPLAALRLTLREAPPPAPLEDDPTWTDLLTNLSAGRFRDAMVTFPMVGGLMLRCMEYGAFVVQFLRWWDSRGRTDVVLPPPPPPQRDSSAARHTNRCPLCRRPWRAPTALPVSGYVFCYVCISRWMRHHSRCPLTALPAAPTHLLRVYLP